MECERDTEGGALRGRRDCIFSIHDKKDYEIHEIVQQVYDALKEKGYNPVNQLVAISCRKTLPTSRPIRTPAR